MINKKTKNNLEKEIFFICEHNYILIKSETVTNVYKCSKCGKKIRKSKNEGNNYNR